MNEQPLSRKGFKIAALIYLVIGLLTLVIPSLYLLLKLMINAIIKPFIYINNVIGSTILSIIGNNLLIFIAFFFIVTAVIFGIGYFIKDDYDRSFYQLLIYLSWFVIPLVIFLSILASAPESIMIGFSFLVYVSPVLLYIVYKGLRCLLGLIIADLCHNPFK